jgi:predicted ATPase
MMMTDLPVFLHCSDDRLKRPSLDGTSLHSDGSNLSAVLAMLKLNDPDKFNLIENTLQHIIPQFLRIRFDQVPVRDIPSAIRANEFGEIPTMPVSVSGFQLLIDTANVVGIPADFASLGMLLSLAIISAIVINDSEFESIVLVDHLDASLHPSTQRCLIEEIRKLLDLRPNLQIIAASHSPYLLDSLEFDEVRLTTLRDNGTVACGRLIDHPEFERWKDEMTPGEMWAMFGEKWLVEQETVA